MRDHDDFKVLLVDDNQHMRAIITTILLGLGMRNVRGARDGEEALKILADWPADLAIVDFKMSPMDGVDFTRLVRNAPDSADPYLPIIMLTGFAEQNRVIEARDAGVTEIIAKPVTAKALAERINILITKPRPFVRTRTYFGPRRPGIDRSEDEEMEWRRRPRPVEG